MSLDVDGTWLDLLATSIWVGTFSGSGASLIMGYGFYARNVFWTSDGMCAVSCKTKFLCWIPEDIDVSSKACKTYHWTLNGLFLECKVFILDSWWYEWFKNQWKFTQTTRALKS